MYPSNGGYPGQARLALGQGLRVPWSPGAPTLPAYLYEAAGAQAITWNPLGVGMGILAPAGFTGPAFVIGGRAGSTPDQYAWGFTIFNDPSNPSIPAMRFAPEAVSGHYGGATRLFIGKTATGPGSTVLNLANVSNVESCPSVSISAVAFGGSYSSNSGTSYQVTRNADSMYIKAAGSSNASLVLNVGNTGYGAGAENWFFTPNLLQQRNSSNSQRSELARTYADASNYQRLAQFFSGTTALIHNEAQGTPLLSGTCGSVAFNDEALATDATRGFVMVPSCPGPPTGTPADIPTGQIPVIIDSATDRLGFYSTSWKYLSSPSTAETLTNKTLGNLREAEFEITDAAGFEINPANGPLQTVVLGGNRTPVFTNFQSGQSVKLKVDDGDGNALTLSGAVAVGQAPGSSGSALTLGTTGYTHIEFWKEGSVVYYSLVGYTAT